MHLQRVSDGRLHRSGRAGSGRKIRDRPAGAALGRPGVVARRRTLCRRYQPSRPGLCGDGAKPYRPRHHRNIDTAAARAMPGVLAVYTAADLAKAGIGSLPERQVLNNRDGTPMLSPTRYALPSDKVRYVGEAVAAVIAETVAQAKDAAELVEVDIDALPAVTEPALAAAPDAPFLYD